MDRPPYRVYNGKSGFSLIEIVLAIGIISFALVGILGLFPVAVNAAANSQNETQAALIARSIFDQLGDQPESNARSVNLAETFDSQTPSPIKVDLLNGTTAGPLAFDVGGKPLPSVGDPDTVFQAEVKITPTTTTITAPLYGSSTVLVTVKSKNSSYSFPSILGGYALKP
jgi:uncharacterized protein (TIGR02598 family)